MLVTVLLLVELTGLREQFSLPALRALLEANLAAGVLLFVLAFAIGNLIQLPGWPFLAAAILVPLLRDKDKILELAAAEVKRQAGADLVVAGEVDLSIFPTLGVSLGDVTLDMPLPDQPSLAARHLQIGVQVMPLLSLQPMKNRRKTCDITNTCMYITNTCI